MSGSVDHPVEAMALVPTLKAMALEKETESLIPAPEVIALEKGMELQVSTLESIAYEKKIEPSVPVSDPAAPGVEVLRQEEFVVPTFEPAFPIS